MYRLLAAIILFFCTLNAAAFSIRSNNNKALAVRRSILRHGRREMQAATSFKAATPRTAINAKVRVVQDANERKQRLNPAVFKNALYLGSIAVAVVLPVVLLVAGSSK